MNSGRVRQGRLAEDRTKRENYRFARWITAELIIHRSLRRLSEDENMIGERNVWD